MRELLELCELPNGARLCGGAKRGATLRVAECGQLCELPFEPSVSSHAILWLQRPQRRDIRFMADDTANHEPSGLGVRLCALALVGAFLGFGAETIHQRAGVWILPDKAAQPWWIVGVYFVALLSAGVAFSWYERRIQPALSVSRSSLAVEVALFLALFLSPPFLHSHEITLTVAASSYLALRLVFFRRRGDLAVVIGVICLNLAVELALVSANLYAYSTAQWLPVPLWLAPLWGGLGLGLRRFFSAAESA